MRSTLLKNNKKKKERERETQKHVYERHHFVQACDVMKEGVLRVCNRLVQDVVSQPLHL